MVAAARQAQGAVRAHAARLTFGVRSRSPAPPCRAVSAISNPPLVWSCSWGTPEAEKGPDGLAFIERATQELIKMGVRGMTLMFASGDAGATAAGRGGQCGVLQVCQGLGRVGWRGAGPHARRGIASALRLPQGR